MKLTIRRIPKIKGKKSYFSPSIDKKSHKKEKPIEETFTDIFENEILCSKCNKKTRKNEMIKDGFKIRIAECPNCGKIWYHPGDIKSFEEFKTIKKKNFNVKLRTVGNSFCISIPKEIILFKELENIEKEMDRIVRLCLEEPNKLSLFFMENFKRMDNAFFDEDKEENEDEENAEENEDEP